MHKDEQVRVESHRSFTKNPVRGTVVNTNQTAYEARKTKLRAAQEQEERLSKLEEDVGEIKDMLKQLLER